MNEHEDKDEARLDELTGADAADIGALRRIGTAFRRIDWRVMWEDAGMFLVFVLLFVGCSIGVERFFTVRSFQGLALAVSMTGMVACTMLFCLASGDFDLSVGSVVAFSGVVAAVTINATGSVFAGIVAGMASGGLVGLTNGFVIAKLKVNALIATLAMMQIARGLAYIVAGGTSVGVSRPAFYRLGNSAFLRIPTPVWITAACFLVFGLLLRCTTFGRNTLAIGGNKEAARLAGIPVDRIKIIIFALQGLMAGFAGVVLASRVTSGQPKTSEGFELRVISACVLGGVSLTGGVGSMLFVISGVLIMGTVEHAMTLESVQTFWQYVVRGSILLGAVLLDKLKQRRS
ncbi:MAG: L-arabinose ABC transporter permease AraH [Planctomycetota bacterium]|jgi:L-arabinose transport system permease protein